MTHSFNFMRPFKRLKDDEINQGIIHNAIFIWGTRPYEHTSLRVDDDHQIQYVSRFEHCLWFDLWLVKGAISWQGKHQNAPKN